SVGTDFGYFGSPGRFVFFYRSVSSGDQYGDGGNSLLQFFEFRLIDSFKLFKHFFVFYFLRSKIILYPLFPLQFSKNIVTFVWIRENESSNIIHEKGSRDSYRCTLFYIWYNCL